MKRVLHGLIFSLFIAASPGQPSPSLDAPTLQGPRFSLDRLRGRVVVVDFWASWCEPCRRSFPGLSDLARRYASRGVTVVGVSVDDEASNYQRFVRELHPTFAVVHDASHQIADRWGPSSMPTTYVVGRDGVITAVFAGEDTRQLEASVLAALGEAR